MKRIERTFVNRGYRVLDKSTSSRIFGENYLFKHPNKNIYVFVICDGEEIKFYLGTDPSKFEFYFDYPFGCYNEDVVNSNFEGSFFNRIIYNRFGI